MKLPRIFPLSAVTLFSLSPVFSQEAPVTPETGNPVGGESQAVASIPEIPTAEEEEAPIISFTEGLFPEDDGELFRNCIQLIQLDRTTEAVMGIEELKRRDAPESELTYLDFSIHFQLREFDKAKAIVEAAREKEWAGFREDFNYAQCLFLLKDFEVAAGEFEKLAETEEIAANVLDTIRFQQFVSLAKAGRKDTPEAKAVDRDYDEFSDSPIYYFIKAVHEFEEDRGGEASAWIRSAQGIYPPASLATYTDTLFEAGYMFDLNYPGRVDFEELKKKRAEAAAAKEAAQE